MSTSDCGIGVWILKFISPIFDHPPHPTHPRPPRPPAPREPPPLADVQYMYLLGEVASLGVFVVVLRRRRTYVYLRWCYRSHRDLHCLCCLCLFCGCHVVLFLCEHNNQKLLKNGHVSYIVNRQGGVELSHHCTRNSSFPAHLHINMGQIKRCSSNQEETFNIAAPVMSFTNKEHSRSIP